MKNLTGKIILVVLALGLSTGIWLQAKTNAVLREEQVRLLAQAAELARLRDLQAQRKTSATSPAELEKIGHESDEAERLRSRIRNLKDTQAWLAALKIPADAVQLNCAEIWHNVGQATPVDTLHSVIWASLNGEVEALMPMLAFDPESRAEAEALRVGLPEAVRAQYPTVEKLIATMISGRLSTGLYLAEDVGQTNESPDLTSVNFHVQRALDKGRQLRDVTFRFQRNGSGWRLLVPKSAVAEYRRSLETR
jgi:lambda repressor-like predicted transcriptional regulator